MKKRALTVCVALLLGLAAVSAIEISPGWTYGAELGLSRGDNAGSKENLAPMGRAYLQLEIFKFLYMRTGIGYTPLHASKTYSTSTFMGDTRFIINPMKDKKYSPFLYAGAGASLELGDSEADVIPLFPLGLGLQVKLRRGLDLEVAAGYYISNSDMLDTRPRPIETEDNLIASEKQDGFFSLTVGLAMSDPGPQQPRPRPLPVVEKPIEQPAPKPEPVVEKPAPKPEPVTVKPKPEPVVEQPVVVAPKPEPVVEKPVVVPPKPEPVVEKPVVVEVKWIDSDGDELSDFDEINVYLTDPYKADTDGDGLTDYEEIMKYKTDPLKPDTDGDGLMDGAEVNHYKTDPLKPDTDGDGLMDGAEVNQYKTDPLNVDTDGDGLNDGQEVNQHKTNPLNKDTDGDGLSDFDEVVQYKTDPLNVDTDGDGLTDYAELMNHKTDPLLADSDKGTINDGDEVAQGKDPLDPKDDVLDLTAGSTFSLEGILFETAKSTILPQSIPILEQAYQALAANPTVKILIVGHTDNVGSDASNLTLSKNRSAAVKKWLVDRGIATDRIRTDGKGESQPRATNDTADGRALNRRIEFVIE